MCVVALVDQWVALVDQWVEGERIVTHMETGEIRSLLHTVHKSHLQMDTILKY